jgi:hypothetical protein
MKSSARPADLEAYAAWAEEPYVRLLTGTRMLEIKFDRFIRSSPDRTFVSAPPTDALLRLLARSIATDRWVGDVGDWFDLADSKTKLAPQDQERFYRLSKEIWSWSKGKTVRGATSYNGFDPRVAPRSGSYEVAGYGKPCGVSTQATSFLGPDGLTYPVILPTDDVNKGMPADQLPGHILGADDTGRTWTTTSTSLTSISEDPGLLAKLAGAIAFTGGYRPINGSSVSSKELKDSLVITADGYPILMARKVNGTYQPLDDLPPNPSTSKTNNALQGGIGAAELVLSGAGGWAMVANDNTGVIQTVLQTDANGNRRALVRGYQVRKDSQGFLAVTCAYWTGTSWIEVEPPTRAYCLPG